MRRCAWIAAVVMVTMAAVLAGLRPPLLAVSTAAFTGTLPATNAFTAAASFGTHAQQVLADGATGYWRLNDPLAGDDAVSPPAPAIVSGGVTTQVAGAVGGSALRVDGTGKAAVPSSTTYRFPGTASFTVEAWVKATTVDTNYRMIALCDTTSGGREGWYLWQHSTGGLGFERFQAGSGGGTRDNTALTSGTWTHVAATFDGTTLRLYRNGTLAASNPSAEVIGNQPCTLTWGNWPGNTSYVGDVDEGAVYSGALSAARIAAHYAARGTAAAYAAAVTTDNPLGYWRFEGGAAAADSSPTAQHGTYNGSLVGQASGGLSGSTDTATRFASSPGAVITMPYTTNYTFAGTSPFSVEAWVRPTTVDTSYRAIVTCYSNTSPREGWSVWQRSGTGVGFERFQAGAQMGVTDSTSLTSGSWSHVVATFDGTDAKLYRDGQFLATANGVKSIAAAACILRVGGGTASLAGYDGDIDEVAVYPTALTPTQILLHYWRRQ